MNSKKLPKSYDPLTEEPTILKRWAESKPFHADPADPGDPFCILIPLPNVTDKLHLGHALNNSLQDILTRYHRSNGFNAMWMPGTDHAGIATQTVVEKRVLQEEGKRRNDFDRDEFVGKIQAWKDVYQATILAQLREMGCSCDWDRTRFTMDEVCAAAVREAFFQLFKDGLIYRGKRLVNWDPATQTALADDEVETHDVEGHFWYMQYPLIGDPITIGDKTYDHVTVATTRPETMLGDTAVAMNRRDPRWPLFEGRKVRLPIVNREIPIIEDDYVVLAIEQGGDPNDTKAQYATGFLKVTPAHDPNDYEIGQRHDLPIINVLAPDGTVSDKYGWDDVGGGEFTLDLDRYEAREAIVEWFRENNLLEEVKPYTHAVGHSYRSHVAIEPYLSDQWYVAVTKQLPDRPDIGCIPETEIPLNSLAGFAWRSMTSEQRSEGKQITKASGTGVSPVSEFTKGEYIKDKSLQNSGTGVPPVRTTITGKLSKRSRNLPHWELGGRTYFITFRLAQGELSPEERRLVLSSCMHWHKQRVQIRLVTVMHDHVHLLLTPLRKDETDQWYPLQELLHSIKSYTAHEINRMRRSTGRVWQDEYFDRIVRNDEEYAQKWEYMRLNPVRAGLVQNAVDYEFTARPEDESWCKSEEQENGRDARSTDANERADGRDARSTDANERADGRDARSTDANERADGRDARSTVFSDTDSSDAFMDGTLPWEDTLRFYPERYAKTFQTWHENLRDWCVSRQLWWGHRIPVWSVDISQVAHPDKDETFTSEFNTQLKAMKDAGRIAEMPYVKQPTRDQPDCDPSSDRFFFCIRDSSDQGAISLLEENGCVQDPDVLDTWFSSALWPMSTMGWPNPEAFAQDFPEQWDVLEKWNPTTVLCTAREIITLWVSRMVMFNVFFLDRLPYRDVFIHAMIQDGDGRKMSKSLGNGVDPRDIIQSKGADAMRFTLAQMTTQTQDVRMPVEFDEALEANTSPKFEVGRRLCNKLWNATRFTLSTLDAIEGPGQPDSEPTRLVDRWMLSRLARCTQQIERSLADYQFNTYAQSMYDLFWRDFCDWYLEAIKPTIREEATQQSILRAVLGSMHRLFHPLMPFITETLHESIESLSVKPINGIDLPSADLAAKATWPSIDCRFIDDEAEAEFETARSLISAIREVRASHNVPDRRLITLYVGDDETAKVIADAEGAVEALAGLGCVETGHAEAPAGSLRFTVGGVEHVLSDLTEALDHDAEHQRLTRRQTELEKQIKAMQGRLSNKGYIEKAPDHLVQETRNQLTEAEKELETIKNTLLALNA